MPPKPKKKGKGKKGAKKAPKINPLEVVLKQILQRAVVLIREKDDAFVRAATKIQAAFRAWRVRLAYPDTHALFERRQRRIQARLEAERREAAAVRIQTFWRGYRARRWYNRILEAVVKIQAQTRGHLARRWYRRYRAARTIQRFARGFLARKKLRRIKAAIVVQKYWRGYRARQLRRHLLRTRAAIKIQTAVRGFLARQELKRRRRAALEKKAATTIQRFVRGFLARRLRARMVAEREFRRRTAAALAIQRAWRGYYCRRHVMPRLRSEAPQCERCRRLLAGDVFVCGLCLLPFHRACAAGRRNPFTREVYCDTCSVQYQATLELERGPIENGLVVDATTSSHIRETVRVAAVARVNAALAGTATEGEWPGPLAAINEAAAAHSLQGGNGRLFLAGSIAASLRVRDPWGAAAQGAAGGGDAGGAAATAAFLGLTYDGSAAAQAGSGPVRRRSSEIALPSWPPANLGLESARRKPGAAGRGPASPRKVPGAPLSPRKGAAGRELSPGPTRSAAAEGEGEKEKEAAEEATPTKDPKGKVSKAPSKKVSQRGSFVGFGTAIPSPPPKATPSIQRRVSQKEPTPAKKGSKKALDVSPGPTPDKTPKPPPGKKPSMARGKPSRISSSTGAVGVANGEGTAAASAAEDIRPARDGGGDASTAGGAGGAASAAPRTIVISSSNKAKAKKGGAGGAEDASLPPPDPGATWEALETPYGRVPPTAARRLLQARQYANHLVHWTWTDLEKEDPDGSRIFRGGGLYGDSRPESAAEGPGPSSPRPGEEGGLNLAPALSAVAEDGAGGAGEMETNLEGPGIGAVEGEGAAAAQLGVDTGGEMATQAVEVA